MKKVAILLSLIIFIVACKPNQPIAVVSNGDTIMVSPIDDSLYMKLQCKYDSLLKSKDAENDSAFNYLVKNRHDLLHENDSLKAIILSSKKTNCDSLRIALTRANLKVIRVKYYLNLANKNPKKYGVFLKGWLNGLFVDQ